MYLINTFSFIVIYFQVYQCEEKDFHQLHDMLIRKQTNKCNILPGQPNYGNYFYRLSSVVTWMTYDLGFKFF